MTKRNKKLRFSCRKSTTSVDSQKEFNTNNKIEQHSEGSTEIDFDTKAVLYNMEQTKDSVGDREDGLTPLNEHDKDSVVCGERVRRKKGIKDGKKLS